MRAVAHSLQVANVPVRNTIAATHRLRVFANTDAGFSSPADGGRIGNAVGHLTLQPLSALRVTEAPGPPAWLSFTRGAHWAAITLVKDVTGEAVGWNRSTERLVTFVRATDDMTFGDSGFTRTDRKQQSDAQNGQKHVVTAG